MPWTLTVQVLKKRSNEQEDGLVEPRGRCTDVDAPILEDSELHTEAA